MVIHSVLQYRCLYPFTFRVYLQTDFTYSTQGTLAVAACNACRSCFLAMTNNDIKKKIAKRTRDDILTCSGPAEKTQRKIEEGRVRGHFH